MNGLIPRPFIDELLNQTDVVEFIDSHVPLKKRGTSYTACCPFHSEKNPSFSVVAKKQFYHCFGCGASGNAISFAMNYLHLSFSDAIETLAARIGLQVPREGRSKDHQQSLSLYDFLARVTQFYQKTLKTSGSAAISYLKQRQITGEIAHKYQLGYAPPDWRTLEVPFKNNKKELIDTGMLIVTDDGKSYDRYRHRILFPIHDRHGRIIGFGGRSIDADQKPKYLNSPETIIFQKGRELYGLHHVLKQSEPITSIIIVEGYIDVISLAQHGVPNAVATLGTATSTYHIQLLSKYTKRLIFCFDGDDAGRQAAWRALESSLAYLDAGLDANFIFLPQGHDPDSLVREEGRDNFLNRLKMAAPLSRFFIETISKDIDTTELAGKSQLVTAAKPYLIKMADGPYKELIIEELARLTHIENHRIHQLTTEKTVNKQSHESNNQTAKANKRTIRSPMRIAVALLLQHPEIYPTCVSACSPELLDAPKHRLLKKLMQQIADHPSITTAQLIESWRESAQFDALNKLAAWDHQVPEAALANEFIDTVLFLAKENNENAIKELLEKAHQQGLTPMERQNLQEKLKQRHKT